MTSVGYLIPTQNRVFSYPTSRGFVRLALGSPGLPGLQGFCSVHLADASQPVT